MARDWAALGITWEACEVSRRAGTNATDKRVLGEVEIPVLTDIDKAMENGLTAAIHAGVNGTSWRVTAQDVGRAYLENTKKADRDTEALREKVYARLLGMRASGTRTVRVVIGPDGEQWTLDTITERTAAYMASLVDAGVPAMVARGLAEVAAEKVRIELEK